MQSCGDVQVDRFDFEQQIRAANIRLQVDRANGRPERLHHTVSNRIEIARLAQIDFQHQVSASTDGAGAGALRLCDDGLYVGDRLACLRQSVADMLRFVTDDTGGA